MDCHRIDLTYGSLPRSIIADTCSRSFSTLAAFPCGEVVVAVVVAAVLSMLLGCLYFCCASTLGNNTSCIHLHIKDKCNGSRR